MQNKSIVLVIIIFLVLSFSFLAFEEKKDSNIDSQNLWFLYFKNPKDKTLDFTIENHSENTAFHWEIIMNKTKIKEADTTIKKGQSETIPVSAIDISEKKILIIVTDSENKQKEIYKNF